MAEVEYRTLSTANNVTPPHSALALDSAPLEPPRASFFSGPGSSIGESASRHSAAPSATGLEFDKESLTAAQSAALLPAGKESEDPPSQAAPRTRPLYRRPVWLAIAFGTLAVLILAIILPVYFTVIRKNGQSNKLGNNPGTSSGNKPSPTGNPESPSGATWGGNGSTIISGNTSFVYLNPFGGYWVYDPKNPFNDSASPNSWTKPLNQSWDWSTDKVYGVNLGGLFVLEPFISPALFQKYPTANDEWSLSVAMAADTGPGGGLQSQLEAHYDTFITEQDIAEIAGAGLNWIRLPIPFWAIEVWPGEPFLPKVCWSYILRIFAWARKYGIRVNLDLHTVPGSQNGYNHSGRYGQVNFLSGIMGIANAQRTLDYIRIITEFISQPEYRNVVPVFSIVNEATVSAIGLDQLASFYLHAHDIIRGITGYGAGKGPYIAIHDGFALLTEWANILPGVDRVAIDTHPYFAFNGQSNTGPIVADDGIGEPGGIWPQQACNDWAPGIANSQTAFGITFSGEFSSGFNPCGLFLLATTNAATTEGTCQFWIDSSNWNATVKQGILDFTLASMDALQNWWFWTWKVGPSSVSGNVESPLWSYQLGLNNGWIPTDPRTSVGKCKALGAGQTPFAGTYSAWQTGGAGAGTIPPSVSASFPWPPATLSGVVGDLYAALPTYTPTGSISTLPPARLTPSASEGDGWFNAQDTAGAMVTVSGCSYANAWDSAGAVAPTAPCPAGASPLVTASPRATSATASKASTSVTA